MEENREATTSGGDGGREIDRISALPDDTIHEIIALALKESPILATQIPLLSKRFNQVWHSYPVLELNHHSLRSEDSLETSAAACKKFFNQRSSSDSPPAAVRIRTRRHLWRHSNFLPEFLDDLLNLTLTISPQEIEFEPGSYDSNSFYGIPRTFFLVGRRLKVLKLRYCDFRNFAGRENNLFAGLGSSLKVLSLREVKFPDEDGRILSSMISGATLLEDLSLDFIIGTKMYQIRNHPNLKSIKFIDLVCDYIRFSGEKPEGCRRFVKISMADFQLSMLPNLRTLHFEGVRGLTNEKIIEVVSEIPSLESLTLLKRIENDLEIVNTDKLRKVKLFRAQKKPRGFGAKNPLLKLLLLLILISSTKNN